MKKIRIGGFVIEEIVNDVFIVKIHRPTIAIWNANVLCNKKEGLKIKAGDTVIVEIESFESKKALITHKF